MPDRRYRHSGRFVALSFVLPVLATLVVVIASVAAFVIWSAHASDRVERNREIRSVHHAISHLLSAASADQKSVTVSDEAVLNTQILFDKPWIHQNLGVALFENFDVDLVYLLDPEDQPAYAMLDGASVRPDEYRSDERAIAPLIADVRRQVALDSSDSEGEKNAVSAGYALIRGRAAIVAAKPIIPQSVEYPETNPFMHVAVVFLDAGITSKIISDTVLPDLRFSWNTPPPDLAGVPLRDRDGTNIGYFVWTPFKPGSIVLQKAVLPASLGVTALAILVVSLLIKITGASRRIIEGERRALEIARTDRLTGLANRYACREALGAVLSRKGNPAVGLVFFDLDHFQRVNRIYGETFADEVLREASRRLSALVADRAMAARIGGDTFAIILREIECERDLHAFCDDLRRIFLAPITVHGVSITFTISAGAAMADEEVSEEELFQRAEFALAEAKSAGRRCTRLYTPELDRGVKRRNAIESALRTAVEDGGLHLLFQPIFSGQTLQVVACEALLRWRHPELGDIPPSEFIPIAEANGSILAIGEWVLRDALANAARWPGCRIAINTSPVQIETPGFAEIVADLILEAGCPASQVEVEVTEGVLLDPSGRARETLGRLRSMGIRIALDDFGTGYSSLHYLEGMEVDTVKIDQSFVRNLHLGSRSSYILMSILAMANALGLEVIAEGVETEEQRLFLASLGRCNLQGYLLSRPLPPAAIEALLRAEGLPRRSRPLLARAG